MFGGSSIDEAPTLPHDSRPVRCPCCGRVLGEIASLGDISIIRSTHQRRGWTGALTRESSIECDRAECTQCRLPKCTGVWRPTCGEPISQKREIPKSADVT